MNKETVLSLFKYMLLHEFSRSLDTIIQRKDLNHRKISEKVGNSPSWFNGTYNHLRDIQVSSLLRILAVLPPGTEKSDGSSFGEELFNQYTLWLASVYIRLKEETDKPTIDIDTVMQFLRIEGKISSDFKNTVREISKNQKLPPNEVEVLSLIKRELKREEENEND